MWRDDAYLLDILIACRRVLKFTEGMNSEEFQKNEVVQYAVMIPLQIIGEAAGKISQPARDAHPEIPWKHMIGMRNRLVHEYFRIKLDKVWETIRDDVPKLIPLIEPLVPPESEV
jgi:uncharacterized protein with HEPN domain